MRGRSRLASAVVGGFKFVFRARNQPDTVMRDWLIYMDLIATFLIVIVAWSAGIESGVAAN